MFVCSLCQWQSTASSQQQRSEIWTLAFVKEQICMWRVCLIYLHLLFESVTMLQWTAYYYYLPPYISSLHSVVQQTFPLKPTEDKLIPDCDQFSISTEGPSYCLRLLSEAKRKTWKRWDARGEPAAQRHASETTSYCTMWLTWHTSCVHVSDHKVKNWCYVLIYHHIWIYLWYLSETFIYQWLIKVTICTFYLKMFLCSYMLLCRHLTL